MNNNATTHEQIKKMANSVKLAAVLSLAAVAYEVYRYLKESINFQQAITVLLGLVGTVLIWLFGRELQSGRKKALLFWTGLIIVGSTRFVASDGLATANVSLIVLIGLWIIITWRLIVWTRSNVLT